MNPEIYADKIFVFKDYFSNPQEVVDLMDSATETLSDLDVFNHPIDWATSSKDKPHTYGTIIHTTTAKLDTSSEHIKQLYSRIVDSIKTAGKFYSEKCGLEYREEDFVGISLFKYNTGEAMGPHVDDDSDPNINPSFTVLIYLNDDKVGGDLAFPQQDIVVKSSAGTMVIFPCTAPFYHASTMITNGVKYHIGSGWKRTNNKG
jgi:predicted 2-oxoglutarate/Fe(II)-dependent dioxygenase YbiX